MKKLCKVSILFKKELNASKLIYLTSNVDNEKKEEKKRRNFLMKIENKMFVIDYHNRYPFFYPQLNTVKLTAL